MSQPTDPKGGRNEGENAWTPEARLGLGDPGEHPLSVLIFAPLRTKAGATFILVLLALACFGLAATDVILPKEAHGELEAIPVFYGVFGFLAFGLAVLSGWPLGRLLRRDEDFYERRSGRADREGRR